MHKHTHTHFFHKCEESDRPQIGIGEHAFLCLCVYGSVCMHITVHVCVCVCTRMYACMNVHAHTEMCTGACISMLMHVHVNTCMHLHNT